MPWVTRECPGCVMTRRVEGMRPRFDDLFGSLAQRRGFREYLAGSANQGGLAVAGEPCALVVPAGAGLVTAPPARPLLGVPGQA